ncbi:hypothetical protein NE237_017388 [Protea cynaroides]|uniref:Uncharacterized protein n=1 Tax=Protea cynaroides TaxID=273540 RepID=A0A9Q0K7Y0_9MAGN|nr:hypothetical protein NE237_017388 [Protea cynaroides]
MMVVYPSPSVTREHSTTPVALKGNLNASSRVGTCSSAQDLELEEEVGMVWVHGNPPVVIENPAADFEVNLQPGNEVSSRLGCWVDVSDDGEDNIIEEGEFERPPSDEHEAETLSQGVAVMEDAGKNHKESVDGMRSTNGVKNSSFRHEMVEAVPAEVFKTPSVNFDNDGVTTFQPRRGVTEAAPSRVVITFEDIVRADKTLHERESGF